jgi:hypothetical protein
MPAAFATGIIAAATMNAETGVSTISKGVANLSSACPSLLSFCHQNGPSTLTIDSWTFASQSARTVSGKMRIAENHSEPEKLVASVRRRWQKIEVYVKTRYVDLLLA